LYFESQARFGIGFGINSVVLFCKIKIAGTDWKMV
jgi:hypothetical protein